MALTAIFLVVFQPLVWSERSQEVMSRQSSRLRCCLFLGSYPTVGRVWGRGWDGELRTELHSPHHATHEDTGDSQDLVCHVPALITPNIRTACAASQP